MAEGKVRVEEWRDVVGYEGRYEVSNFGRVRSVARHDMRGQWRPARILAGAMIRGYHNVLLYMDSKRRGWRVHHLVALAFLGEAPGRIGTRRDEWQINHINGRKEDNRPENLEWVRPRANLRHARRTGLNENHGEDVNTAILTEDQVRDVYFDLYPSGARCYEIAERLGVEKHVIYHIVSGDTWKHVTGGVDIRRGDTGMRPTVSQSLAELNAMHQRLGTWDAVADSIGVGVRTLHKHRRRKREAE